MKALCLVTATCNCEIMARSVEAAGHECIIEQYTNRPHDRHVELVTLAKLQKPDFIIYIGAIEQSAECLPVPSVDVLCSLNDVAPMIHICGDACDSPWWNWLNTYDQKQCFTVQVGIDGTTDNPIANFKNGMLLLTPVDCRVFNPLLWSERSIRLGMVGGLGHSRRHAAISTLSSQQLLSFTETYKQRPYAEMASIMCNTKLTLDNSDNGSGNGQHVKGRVIEAGFAGCCLLETRGSPTANWFTPGHEYIEYDSPGEVATIINRNDEELSLIAYKFRSRMIDEHHPKIFWDKVLHKAGLC